MLLVAESRDMANVSRQMLTRVMAAYGIDFRSTRSLGGSDGAVFACESSGGSSILKIIPLEASDVERVCAQEGFREYLGGKGVKVAALIPTASGEKVMHCQVGEEACAAVLHARVRGQVPDLRTMLGSEPDLLVEWGALLGRMHALSSGYASDCLATWQDECRMFAEWCHDPIIRDQWIHVGTVLDGFSQEQNAYGVVHNDLHIENLILSPNGLVPIDFSVSCYHWFCTDIGVAMFLWAWLGKAQRGETHQEMVRRCFDSFYSGYSREHQLSEAWLRQLSFFCDYRRLLLYTVFTSEWGDDLSGWQKHTLSGWRRDMLNGMPMITSL